MGGSSGQGHPLHSEATDTFEDYSPRRARRRLLARLGLLLVIVVLVAAGISVAGRWYGKSLAMGGHTDETMVFQIELGSDVLRVPANMIRFEHARRHGAVAKLDLYMRWPQMDGFSLEARHAFNHENGSRELLFLSVEERMMSRDMSGRYEPIYKAMVSEPGRKGPAGLMVYSFPEGTGYVDELLVVENSDSAAPFVMRCLSGAQARDSLAPCERDIHLGRGLSLTYRMPASLASSWREVDAAVKEAAESFLAN